MTHLSAVPSVAPGEQADTGAAPETPPPATRQRTRKLLPTDRIAFPKQLDVLRAFVAASADGGGSASNNTAADIVKMSHHTVVLTNPFFTDIGLLSRADRGRLTPSQAVRDFAGAFQWTPETAAQRLAPVIRKSWFGSLIVRKVSVNPRDEDEILSDLSNEAGANPAHKAQLELLIEYAIAAGLVERNGRQLVQARQQPTESESAAAMPQPPQKPAEEPAGSSVQTVFDAAEGVVQFNVTVKVRMSEFAAWRPERISAFFGGIAAVLAAKARVEDDASEG